MIDALVTGELHGAAQSRTMKDGREYATALVRVPMRQGASLTVRVTAFRDSAVAALLALSDGDGVAVAGQLTPGVWTDKEGQVRPQGDLVANMVVSVFDAKRRKDEGPGPKQARLRLPKTAAPADDVPF
jgi:single-stranded DNA-binding protein